MGKMFDLICARPHHHHHEHKSSPKAEAKVTETKVLAQDTSSEVRNRSQSDSVTAASRRNEKQELAQLNNHLAGYFDRVHHLENENRQLEVKVTRVEEQIRMERDTGRVNFDLELQRIRDALGKENEKLRAEIGILKPELEKLRSRIAELQQFSRDTEKARIAAVTTLGEMNAKLKGLEDEKIMWEREAMNLQAANQKLNETQKDVDVLLAQERTARVNGEKRLADLLQEFEQFKIQHDKILEVRAQEYTEQLDVTRKELATTSNPIAGCSDKTSSGDGSGTGAKSKTHSGHV